MKKKILHIRKFQDITYFLRRTFRTRTPNFETHPHRLRLRTTTFKINPYRLRLRTTIFKINPYRLRLRPQIWVRERNRYGIRLRTPEYEPELYLTLNSEVISETLQPLKHQEQRALSYFILLKHIFH